VLFVLYYEVRSNVIIGGSNVANIKNFRLEFDTELHASFKALTALEGKKMNEVIKSMVEKYVEEKKEALKKES
jgi:hypothetical protein